MQENQLDLESLHPGTIFNSHAEAVSTAESRGNSWTWGSSISETLVQDWSDVLCYGSCFADLHDLIMLETLYISIAMFVQPNGYIVDRDSNCL